MKTNPAIIPVEGLGEAAIQAQSLSASSLQLGSTIDPGQTMGMYPPAPTFEP